MKSRRRTGVILILVLVLVAILALCSLGFSERMLTERRATQIIGRRMQARVSAESGVEMARLFLDRSSNDQDEVGGWYDNPQRWRGVLVADDGLPRDRGRFTLVAPRLENRAPAGIRYGLEDESARINLCTILKADQAVTDGAKKMLMALPGMTDAIADAILDWIDADSTPRPQGAEADYYAALTPSYAPRNGPPVTIEELLLVRGVTPQLLFGLDAAAMAGGGAGAGAGNGAIEGVDNSDGSMNHGWAAYLTVYSRESTLRADGTPKINLNGSDLKKLYDALQKAVGADWATFIVAYRQGGSQGSSSGANAVAPAGQLDFSQKATATIASVLDLIGVKTSAKFQGAKTKTVLNSPFSEDRSAMSTYLPKLLDNTTVSAEAVIRGRININQASWLVLQGIPGMTIDLANEIIAKRTLDPTVAGAAHRYETWILTEGIVPLATMKTMLPFVNAGGSVYRVQSIGHFEEGGSSAHLEVLLDASKRPTNVLLWRDVSHLSLGGLAEGFGGSGPQASGAEKN